MLCCQTLKFGFFFAVNLTLSSNVYILPWMSIEDFTLQELAEASGQSPRTIRYYIAKEILNGPITAGRGARYGREHLERLRLIAVLKEKGHTLAEISHHLTGESDDEAVLLSDPLALQQFMLSPDVQVLVRAGLSPWHMKQVRKILAEASRQLASLDLDSTNK